MKLQGQAGGSASASVSGLARGGGSIGGRLRDAGVGVQVGRAAGRTPLRKRPVHWEPHVGAGDVVGGAVDLDPNPGRKHDRVENVMVVAVDLDCRGVRDGAEGGVVVVKVCFAEPTAVNHHLTRKKAGNRGGNARTVHPRMIPSLARPCADQRARVDTASVTVWAYSCKKPRTGVRRVTGNGILRKGSQNKLRF